MHLFHFQCGSPALITAKTDLIRAARARSLFECSRHYEPSTPERHTPLSGTTTFSLISCPITGVCQLHRLAAGPCIGTLMLSPTDPIHIALNDNAYDGADDEAMVSMSRDDFAPRLYRVVSATKTTASDALPRQGPSNGEASGACRGGNGATQGVGFQLGERDEHRLRPRSFEWVPISRSRAPESLQIRTERE